MGQAKALSQSDVSGKTASILETLTQAKVTFWRYRFIAIIMQLLHILQDMHW